jgi:hypothetical protein
MGVAEATQALGGGPATPKNPKPILLFFLAIWGWLDHSLGHEPPPISSFFFFLQNYTVLDKMA